MTQTRNDRIADNSAEKFCGSSDGSASASRFCDDISQSRDFSSRSPFASGLPAAGRAVSWIRAKVSHILAEFMGASEPNGPLYLSLSLPNGLSASQIRKRERLSRAVRFRSERSARLRCRSKWKVRRIRVTFPREERPIDANID